MMQHLLSEHMSWSKYVVNTWSTFSSVLLTDNPDWMFLTKSTIIQVCSEKGFPVFCAHRVLCFSSFLFHGGHYSWIFENYLTVMLFLAVASCFCAVHSLCFLFIIILFVHEQLICIGGRLTYRVVCAQTVIMSYTVAFWGTNILECGCHVVMQCCHHQWCWQKSLAFTWCALKWKGLSLHDVHSLFSLTFIHFHMTSALCRY